MASRAPDCTVAMAVAIRSAAATSAGRRSKNPVTMQASVAFSSTSVVALREVGGGVECGSIEPSRHFPVPAQVSAGPSPPPKPEGVVVVGGRDMRRSTD